MGICGTAMGNAALLARAAGHEVFGADSGVYPPMSNVLAAAGITLHEGYDPVRLEKLAPELVVVGNAMSRGNAEVEWLLDTRAITHIKLIGSTSSICVTSAGQLIVACRATSLGTTGVACAQKYQI